MDSGPSTRNPDARGASTEGAALEVEELKREIATLRECLASMGGGSADVEKRIKALEAEKAEAVERNNSLLEENREFAQRYVEMEDYNNSLANLYVATYQLHSTLDFAEVLQILVEILINLIGAEVFTILLLEDRTGEMRVAAHEGYPEGYTFPVVHPGDGILGRVAKVGEPYYATANSVAENPDFNHPIAVVPLKIKERILGLISVEKLFTQKRAFDSVDYELFTLLAAHAASAILSSKLYTQSERKLVTMQSFLELLSSPATKGS